MDQLPKYSPSPIKQEKEETFSMNQLLKSGSSESVIVNGAVNHVHSGSGEKILDLSGGVMPSVIQSTGGSERTVMRASDSVSLPKPSINAGSRNEVSNFT